MSSNNHDSENRLAQVGVHGTRRGKYGISCFLLCPAGARDMMGAVSGFLDRPRGLWFSRRFAPWIKIAVAPHEVVFTYKSNAIRLLPIIYMSEDIVVSVGECPEAVEIAERLNVLPTDAAGKLDRLVAEKFFRYGILRLLTRTVFLKPVVELTVADGCGDAHELAEVIRVTGIPAEVRL